MDDVPTIWDQNIGNYYGILVSMDYHAPLARYVKLRVAHAPGMQGMFSRYRALTIPTRITARAWRTCVTHAGIAN